MDKDKPVEPKTGFFDTLTHWEHEAAKLSPGALLQSLRAAEAQVVANANRILALEQGLVGVLKANKLLMEIVLPAIQAEMAAEGVVIPPGVLLLLEHLTALQQLPPIVLPESQSEATVATT